ncbi:MAG: flagellar filament capping protein FliD [bacterium]
MLSSAGIGSGLDVNGIVSSLMSLERRPLNLLEQKQSDIRVQLSGWGRLSSSISSLQDSATKLQDTTSFGKFTATSSDENIATATVASGSTAESHDIKVITLAEKHRLASDLYSDADTAVGQGTRSFSVDGNAFDVTIDASNDSLTGLRDAINDAAGNNGVAASIINVDGGSRLVLTARESGTKGAITAPAGFNEINAATDAELEVDGFAVTASSNTVSTVLPGITLELKEVGTVQIDTQPDTDGMKDLLNDFVTNYNSLVTTVKSLRDGDLGADGLLLGIEGNIRSQFFVAQDVAGTSTTVFDMGLTFDKDGVLSLDSSKLNEALADNPDRVRAFFTTAETGYGERIKETLRNYTKSDGLISSRQDTLNDRTSSIDDEKERLNFRLGRTEQRYRDQFTRLDSVMAQLNSTSSYLTNQLSQISQLSVNKNN